jgi:excisionase family DNA binding protein
VEPAALTSGNSQGDSRHVQLLLRPEDAANSIGVSRAKFFGLLASREIKSIKIGRSRRVPVAELQAWVAREIERQSA